MNKHVKFENVGTCKTPVGKPVQASTLVVDRDAMEPSWFKQWMRAYGCDPSFPWERLQQYNCVDHYGRVGPYVTMEPYDTAMSSKDWKGLLDFCEFAGLSIKISASSSWNPTHTILIIIYPKGKPGIHSQEVWDGKLNAEEKKKLRAVARDTKMIFRNGGEYLGTEEA